ncbi:MAG: D-aminopeptidase [Acidimicrobiaceae bacterium]|nr:D-aminopeptidase [Acidimicrobiaceae bacterium]
MKVFLSSDMEGTAGVVAWEQCVGESLEAQGGRRLLLDEVNAAIEGAVAGGADEVVVNDSHSTMRNLPPNELAAQASYISGAHKPLYMMQGLDDSYDAVFFVSYHGSIGAPAGLSHTYNPQAITEVRLNGAITGEAGINALVAAHHGVPVVLVTGDRLACSETAGLLKGVREAVVKEPVSRMAAHSLHPGRACALIREMAEDAVRATPGIDPPDFGPTPTLDVSLRTSDIAEAATWVRGVERSGDRAITISDPDPLVVFRSFASAVLLTRTVAEMM